MATGDAPNTPAPLAPPTVTPAEAGAAAAAAVVAQQAAVEQQRLEDRFDIRDPGRPAPAPEPPPQPLAGAPPQTIPGARADAGLTPDLLDRAHRLGIPESDAREYTPALLGKTLDRLEADRRAADSWRQTQFQQQPPAPPRPPEPPAGPKFPDVKFPTLDGEKYEPELVEGFNALRQYAEGLQGIVAQQHAQLQQVTQTWQQQQQQAQQREVRQRFDEFEAAVAADKDLADVLGEGPGTVVSQRSQYERGRVFDVAMGLLERGHARDMDAAYKMARNALHGDRIAQRAGQQAQQQIGERAREASTGRFLSRPSATTRSSDLPPGDERAIRNLTERVRANGQ
jgi:hypothetical protein